MPSTCIIKRGRDRRIASVTTRSGVRSTLYDKIASIPLIENRDRAASFFKTVYSKKFLKKFGNWVSRSPLNKRAYDKVLKSISSVPEQYRDAVLQKAREMTEPMLVKRLPRSTERYGFYSEDIKEGDDVILVDRFTKPRSMSISPDNIPQGMTAEQYENQMVDLSGALFATVTDTSKEKHFIISNNVSKFPVETLENNEDNIGLTYPNGEPRLFFLTDDNRLFDDYGEALRSTESTGIRAGFVAPGAARLTTGAGENPDGPSYGTLSDPEGFIPIMTLSTSTNPSNKQGLINYLIKKKYLSGSKVYDPVSNNYYYTGDGYNGGLRMFNSALAYAELTNRLGDRTQITDRGLISIDNEDATRIRVSGSDGSYSSVPKKTILDNVKAGRYEEMNRRYKYFDDLVLSLILETNNVNNNYAKQLASTLSEEDARQRSEVINILRRLGVRVMGMTDYFEKYQTKYGHEPSAKALADIANGVIAIGENASWADVKEEVAHFLVETYTDQEAINSVLQEVENTEEWQENADNYYDIYGKTLSGAELDTAVRREVLGKILAERLGRPQIEETSFLARLRDLGSRIVGFIRQNLGTARNDLNAVLNDINNSYSQNSISSFDPDLMRQSNFVLYSAGQMDRTSFLKKKIAELRSVSSKLRQLAASRGATTEASLARMANIEAEINKADSRINDHEALLALNGLVSTAEAQIAYLQRLVKSYQAGNELQPSDRQNIQIVNEEVRPFLESLRGFVKNNFKLEGSVQVDGKTLNEASVKNDYTNRIDRAIADISALQSDIVSTTEGDSEAFINDLLKYINIPIQHREKVKKAFFAVQEACGALTRWFGTLEHSSNVMNNALGALIARNNYNAMVQTEEDINAFIKKAKEGNWTVKKYEELIQKHNGKFSKYLKGPLDLARYEYEYKKAQMQAFRTVLPEALKDLTDEKIEETINSDRKFQFTLKVYDENGNIVEKTVSIKPSMRRVNLDILNAEQEKEYSDIMRKWHEENSEQPNKNSYRDLLEQIYEECKASGTSISESTKEYLNNISRQKYMLRQRFYMADGSFDDLSYYRSPEYDDVRRIDRDMRDAMSDYYYEGGLRIEKIGKEAELAKELRAFRDARRKVMDSVRPSRDSLSLSNKFFETLDKIWKGPDGGQEALTFLMRGGHLAFSDRYWEDAGFAQTDRTSSGDRIMYQSLYEAIKNNPNGLNVDAELKTIMENIAYYKKIMRDVLSSNRDMDNPGNVLVEEMTESELDTYRRAAESNETEFQLLMDLARRAGVDADKYLDFGGGVSESEVSDSYMDDLRDSGYWTPDMSGEEYKFAVRHMTPKKRKMVEDFARNILSPNNRFFYTKSQMEFIKEVVDSMTNEKGGTPTNFSAMHTSTDADKRAFKKAFNDWLKKPENAKYKNKIINRYARRLVLPYYKRMAPDGYSAFLNKIRNKEINISTLVRDLENGTETQNYGGFNIRYLQFDPNTRWYDETSQEVLGKNPNYKPDLGFGYHIPSFDKYKDMSYFEEFGIDPNDINGEATRNKEAFDMIKTMKDLNKKAFEKYGINNACIYTIPQISKTPLERVVRSVSNPFEVLGNAVRDWVSNRVDDPLYNTPDGGSNEVDIQDRVKMIPRYFTYDLENQNDVSHDLTNSFAMLTSQANLYREKQGTLKYAMGLQNMMVDSQFNNGKKPEATMAYAMFKDFLNEHYYGVRVNSKKMVVNILGFEVDIAKLASSLNKFFSTMNLAMSPAVALTGALTGRINLWIEGRVGQYVDKDSLTYARKELIRQAPSYISEIGDLDRQSKLYVVGEYLGVFNYRNRLYGAGYNRMARVLTRDPNYKMMEVTNAPLDPTIMIASLDGVRWLKEPVVGNKGTVEAGFYTYEELLQAYRNAGVETTGLKERWKRMREDNLWNCVDVTNGMMNPRAGLTADEQELVKAEMARRRPRVRSLMQICNGSLNEENRVGAARHWLGLFTIAHRGWLFLTAQRLWKKRGYNFQTMQEEEGLLVTLKNILSSVYDLTSTPSLRNISKAWNETKGGLDEVQRTNIIRLANYAAIFVMMNIAAIFIAGWRDDDDNDDSWMAQFGTYIAMRTINEIASQMPGIFALNILDAVEDPFVSARKLGELLDFRNISLDKVTSGVYKDETKLMRYLAKQTFVKQWYNFKTASNIKQTSDWWLQTNNKSMMLFPAFRWNRGEY